MFKLIQIIESIPTLPLNIRIDFFFLNYSSLINEEKAKVLSFWYQYRHNNIFFDDLGIKFNKIIPKIYLPPLNNSNDKNYEFILKGINGIKGYIGIEQVLLDAIRESKETFEIDRLLYILFAISQTYDTISTEIYTISYQNWKRLGKVPVGYYWLLLKTKFDILIHRKDFKAVLEEGCKEFKRLEAFDLKNRLSWLKYQYTILLLKVYENGFTMVDFSEKQLLQKRDECEQAGTVDDYFYELDN